MIVGREKEISRVAKAIAERRNLFVWGQKGVGKTFIIKHVLGILGNKSVIYSNNSTTFKSSLLEFLKDDFNAGFISRQNTLSLKKLFYEKAKREHPYFVFDHIGMVSPKFSSFLDNLLDDYSILIVARSPGRQHIGHLSLLLCFFDKIEMRNLGKRYAYKLIDYFIDVFELNVNNMDYFKKEVFDASYGNPSIIEEICRYAKKSKYRIGQDINFNILNLDRKISSLKL